MRSSLIALAALFAVSGCVIHADNGKSSPPPVSEYSGDITFLWSFGNKTCLAATDVRSVRVRLTGARGVEVLENSGYFPCNVGGIDGIKLRNFAPGDYNFTIDGLDGTGTTAKTLYTASGNVHVNGSVEVPVQLNQVGGTGKLQIFWTFGGGKHCAQSGIGDPSQPVTDIVITLNGETANAVTWPCSNNGVEGVAAELQPGSYAVQLDAYVGDQVWYSASFNATLTAGATRDVAIDLDAVAGAATFMPVLRSTTGQALSCSQAGVKTLWIQLTDWRGNATPPFFDECAKYETSGIYWPWLLAAETFDRSAMAWKGTWTARIEGWDVGSTNHTVLFEGAQQVQVTAGTTAQTFTVNMPRK